jgi:hypothetical protein
MKQTKEQKQFLSFIKSDIAWLKEELKKDLNAVELQALSGRTSNLSGYHEDIYKGD